MSEFTITTEYCGREYKHGKIEIKSSDLSEHKVEISSHLVVYGMDEYEKLCQEIQEVVRKHAI